MPLASPLVGSYENSLLCGRMSQSPSKPLPFVCEIGVLGHGKVRPHSLRCPPHLKLGFDAYFYKNLRTQTGDSGGPGSPYVGTIDLEKHYMDLMMQEESSRQTGSDDERTLLARTPPLRSLENTCPDHNQGLHMGTQFPGYRIPPKGQLQIIIQNPHQTAVKLFLVPYDLSDMPPGTKKVMRQKCYLVSSNSSSPSIKTSTGTSEIRVAEGEKETKALKYAVQIQFCSPPLPARAVTGHDRKVDFQNAFERRSDLSIQNAKPRTCKSKSHNDFALAYSATSTPKRWHTSQSKLSASKASQESKPATSTVKSRKPSSPPVVYLHKSIRVVFNMTTLDSSEKVRTVIDSSADQVDQYVPYAGPGEAWLCAKKAKARHDAGLHVSSQLSSAHHEESMSRSPAFFLDDEVIGCFCLNQFSS